MELKFYRCSVCGQIVAIVKKTSAPIVCCGKNMEEIKPNTSDGSFEKHIPTFKIEKNKVVVTVGEVLHPMLENHYIEWIAIQTNLGNQRKSLNPGDQPVAIFPLLDNEEIASIYCYCNLHSLYKKEVK